MKPQFALNFADETVSLLARHSYGWMAHGQVRLDDEAGLEAGMAALRAKVIELGGAEFATKLVIPASQILYTAVHAPGPTIAERRRQIEAALVGMTPYPVEDLVFDWSGPGKTVHVAVIARDTLREAEDFAESHGMRPVSFVALPQGEEFMGEPWFGLTTYAPEYLAQGDYVQPDHKAIVICTPEEGAAAIAAAQAASEAAEAEARAAEAARVEEERLEYERLEAERLEQERLEHERIEAERLEQERLEHERLEAERLEQERLEHERLEAERLEQERLEHERLEAERLEQERLERERLEAERLEQERLEREEAEQEAARATYARSAQDYEPAEAEPAQSYGAPSAYDTGRYVMDPPQWQDEIDDMPEDMHDTLHARTPRSSLAEELAVYGQEPSEEERREAEYGSDFGAESGPYTEDEFAESPQAASATIGAADRASAQTQSWQNGGSDRISIPESDLDRLRAEFGVERPEDMPGKNASLAAQKADAEQAAATPKLSGARRDLPAIGKGPALHAERGNEKEASARSTPERKAGELRKPVIAPVTEGPALSRKPVAAEDATNPQGRVSITARVSRAADEEDDAPAGDLSERIGGKPKYLGLMLTGVLILVLAILAMLMGNGSESEDLPAAQEQSALSPDAARTESAQTDSAQTDADQADAAQTDTTLTESPTATEPATAELSPEAAASDTASATAEAQPVAATGSVDMLDTPAKRDPEPTVPDAPPPYNQLARIQPDGTVTPTTEGVLMPGNYMLVAGEPPKTPRARPQDVAFAYTEATGKPMPYQAPSLKGKTPRLRPESVVKAAEAAANAPVPVAVALPETQGPAAKPAAKPEEPQAATQSAQTDDVTEADPQTSDPRLSSASPLRARPATVASAAQAEAERRAAEQEAAAQAAAAQATATDQAVTVSRRPLGRPQNFSNAVQSALAAAMASTPVAAAPAPAPRQTARTATPAPQPQRQSQPEADDEPEASSAPTLPTSASVAKAATSDNAIKLNQVNLIGVYGGTTSRRALLRMPNGRFVKVQIGDKFDGGRITAINDNSLTYQKGSRAYRINLIDG
ncbi:hypothetical protein [Thioclava sp. GXIMD2076]|uniref:hypothetical protein n=1 Tax=Thioclava sp. GXIMD2076 TaxID=3131931 RepID=UPI0030CAA7DE